MGEDDGHSGSRDAASAHAAVPRRAAAGAGLADRRPRPPADHPGVGAGATRRPDDRPAAVPGAGDGRRLGRRRVPGSRRASSGLPARQLVLRTAVHGQRHRGRREPLPSSVSSFVAGIVAVLVDRIGRSRLRAARHRPRPRRGGARRHALGRRADRAMLDELRRRSGCTACRCSLQDGDGWRGCLVGCARRRSDECHVESASSATVYTGPRWRTGVRRTSECSMPSPRKSPPQRSEIGCQGGDRPTIWLPRTHYARRCSRRCPTTCARRWHRSRRRSPASASATSTGAGRRRGVRGDDRVGDRPLTVLIDNLLDMSRLQAATVSVSRRPTGVEEVVLSAVQPRRGAGRAVDVDVAPVWRVSADPALLERSLANVIANAVRFEPPDRDVRVTAGPVRRDERRLIDVRVIDHGPGIRSADRERVFQPFQRARRSPSRTAGRRAGARHRPRVRRSDGRRGGDRGHARRRNDDGPQPGRGPGRAGHDSRCWSSTTRRRSAAPCRPTCGARLRRRRGGHR